MTSLTESLTGKGTQQAIEHEEKLVHNVPMAAQNTIVSIAKKVENNVLHMMTTLVVALQFAALQTPVANLLHVLLSERSVHIICLLIYQKIYHLTKTHLIVMIQTN